MGIGDPAILEALPALAPLTDGRGRNDPACRIAPKPEHEIADGSSMLWGQAAGEEASMATSAEWHEGYANMSEAARNFSRAVKSLQEELEAVDWYNQRAEVTGDAQLRRILLHNRNEEIEHAMMALEYLRRINPVFNEHMRTYLFTSGDITEIEAAAERVPGKDLL